MTHGIFNETIFNNKVFNTHSSKIGFGFALSSVAPEQVKPWVDVEEREVFELLIFARPVIKAAFEMDISSVPWLTQYKQKRWKTFYVKASIAKTFSTRFNVTPTVRTNSTVFPLTRGFVKETFKARHILTQYVSYSKFQKTLFAKTHHGINLMRMALKMREEDDG